MAKITLDDGRVIMLSEETTKNLIEGLKEEPIAYCKEGDYFKSSSGTIYRVVVKYKRDGIYANDDLIAALVVINKQNCGRTANGWFDIENSERIPLRQLTNFPEDKTKINVEIKEI